MDIIQRKRIAKELSEIKQIIAHKYITEQNIIKQLNSIAEELEKE